MKATKNLWQPLTLPRIVLQRTLHYKYRETEQYRIAHVHMTA